MSNVFNVLLEPFYWNDIRRIQPPRLAIYSKSMFLSTL